MKNKLISKESFFELSYPNFLFNCFDFVSKDIIGSFVSLHFSGIHPINFKLLLYALANETVKDLLPVTREIRGFCIAIKRKKFATSLILRFVDEGISFDRQVFIFSPKVLFIERLSFSKYKKKYKSKLYFLMGKTSRKMLLFLNR